VWPPTDHGRPHPARRAWHPTSDGWPASAQGGNRKCRPAQGLRVALPGGPSHSRPQLTGCVAFRRSPRQPAMSTPLGEPRIPPVPHPRGASATHPRTPPRAAFVVPGRPRGKLRTKKRGRTSPDIRPLRFPGVYLPAPVPIPAALEAPATPGARILSQEPCQLRPATFRCLNRARLKCLPCLLPFSATMSS